MTVVENSAFSFNISQSLGYPPDPSQNSQRATLTYQWFLNGVPINTSTSINPNVSDYPQIVFSSVMRNQDGNYSITAITEAGSSTGYFILDVQRELVEYVMLIIHWSLQMVLRQLLVLWTSTVFQ